MIRIGVFYSSSTGNCEMVARLIRNQFRKDEVEIFDVLKSSFSNLNNFDHLIFGVPTWDSDVLHEDWKEFLFHCDSKLFNGKSIALFGLGDQVSYANSFANSLGILHDCLSTLNINLVGRWPTIGYHFGYSKASDGKTFVGLVIDEDNQGHLTKGRIEKWTTQLKQEFKLTDHLLTLKR